MEIIFKYFALLIYSCTYFMVMLFLAGLCIAGFYYFNNGWFNFPLSQVKRAIVFGCIAGAAATSTVMIFNFIDKFNAPNKT